jgi:CheY-like chemotaxis protein
MHPPHRLLRVLVVDDRRDCRESLALLVRLWGHDVREAPDGPGALREAQSFRPEAVLLDIGLPGLDGCEVARRLRQMPEARGALLLAVTGYGRDEDVRRCREAGFALHLVKPIDPEQLRALLGEVPGPEEGPCG